VSCSRGRTGNHGFYAKWALFDADYRTIVLDLRDVRLADRDEVKFLRDCEADGMQLENCPAYVREWMEREKD
jgi:hypothetical protein